MVWVMPCSAAAGAPSRSAAWHRLSAHGLEWRNLGEDGAAAAGVCCDLVEARRGATGAFAASNTSVLLLTPNPMGTAGR
jgi:hypothetical protein